MAGELTRVMFFPRYTSVVGAASFASAPFQVRPFYKVALTAWRGTGIDVTNFQVQPEVSLDMREWLPLLGSAWTLDANEQESQSPFLSTEWMRIVIVLTGTDASVPFWVLGEFLNRER